MITTVAVFLLSATTSYAKETDVLEAVAKYLGCKYENILLSEKLLPGEAVSDWVAIAVGCAQKPVKTSEYLKGLEEYVTAAYEEEGGLHIIKATEWHRVSLAVIALGGDPTCFGKDSFGEPINLIADGTYDWSMSDSLGLQGLNAWIFALITLDAKCYEVPKDAVYTREDIISEILKGQTEEGGFGLSSDSPDVDITAMAIQALAPYYQNNAEIQGAVDRAVWWLSAQQGEQGDFSSWGSGSAEGTAQVIIALCSLGIDPEMDERFCKNDSSAVDGLLRYQCANGMFRHTLDGEADVMASEQAALAFIALNRLNQNADRIYDMMSINVSEEVIEDSGFPVWVPITIGVASAGIAVIICGTRGKKKNV